VRNDSTRNFDAVASLRKNAVRVNTSGEPANQME
jgi:hypothetical protein